MNYPGRGTMKTFVLAAVTATVSASPAHAESAVRIPEPADLTLLAIAVAGVIIGRHMARKGRDD
jgi:hypothetical protein